jgi:hypothetical protein
VGVKIKKIASAIDLHCISFNKHIKLVCRGGFEHHIRSNSLSSTNSMNKTKSYLIIFPASKRRL